MGLCKTKYRMGNKQIVTETNDSDIVLSLSIKTHELTKSLFGRRETDSVVGAVDHVFSGGDWRSANRLLNCRHVFCRTRDQRGSGIGDGLTSVLAKGGAGDLNAVHLEFPVTLTSDVDVREVTLVMIWVRATENDFASGRRRWISVEIEAEDVCWHGFLFEHVVEDRLDGVDGDVGISHAQDAVEF